MNDFSISSNIQQHMKRQAFASLDNRFYKCNILSCDDTNKDGFLTSNKEIVFLNNATYYNFKRIFLGKNVHKKKP